MISFASYLKYRRFRWHPKVAQPNFKSLNPGQHEEVRHNLHDPTAKNAFPQTKLKIGPPNDPCEREADRLAGQIVNGATASINSGTDFRRSAPVGRILQKKSAGAVQMKSECPGADTSNRPSPSRVEPSRAQDPDREKGMLH